MIEIPVFIGPLLSRIVVDHLITQSGAADAAKPGADVANPARMAVRLLCWGVLPGRILVAPEQGLGGQLTYSFLR
jgi:hypothetical protein